MENSSNIKDALAQADMMNSMQLRINPFDYDEVTCDKCGNNQFVERYIVRKIPAGIAGATSQDYPIPVLVCAKCGTIIKSVRDDICKASKKNTNKNNLIV